MAPLERDTRRRILLPLLLAELIALVHGLVYVLLLPPWQHYDEPNHFEVVWLAAHLNRMPQAGDYNPKISRQVLKSMVEQGFYGRSGNEPQVGPPSQKVTIPGYPQFGEAPLYYVIASLPVRVLSSASVNVQLHAARLVSLVFFLLVILTAWGAAQDVFPPKHPGRWLVPVTLALMPGITELMTAVNNDAAAVMAFSWFFWAALRCIRRGPDPLNLLGLLAAAILAYFAKNTAMVVLALLPVVLLFTFLRDRWRWLAWAILGVVLLAVPLASLSMDDALAWHRASAQDSGIRLDHPGAVAGKAVLQVEPQAGNIPAWSAPVFQYIPPATARQVFGQAVTLGAWMWASQPVTVQAPLLVAGQQKFSTQVVLKQTPQFFAFHIDLPPGKDRLWVYLDPQPQPDIDVQVYYDGLVLAAGSYPLDLPPQFADASGLQGAWGEQPFRNLLRNPSGEQAAVRVRSWLDNPATNFLPDNARPTLVLASLQDWHGSAYLLDLTAGHLFQTFWARFAWGQVPLLGDVAYPALLALTALALLGTLLGLWRLRRRLPGDIVVVVGLLLLITWGLTVTRGLVYLGINMYYIPPARHAFPSILPAVFVLVFGWVELWRALAAVYQLGARRLAGPHSTIDEQPAFSGWFWRAGSALYVLTFLALDAWSIFSIWKYFTGT